MGVPFRTKTQVYANREPKKAKTAIKRFEKSEVVTVRCSYSPKDVCPLCLEKTLEHEMVFKSEHASCPVCFHKCGCLKQ